MEVVKPDDILAVIINADPDAMASALALKRLVWRRTREALIYHVNTIQRADNLAFIRLLKIDIKNIMLQRNKILDNHSRKPYIIGIVAVQHRF